MHNKTLKGKVVPPELPFMEIESPYDDQIKVRFNLDEIEIIMNCLEDYGGEYSSDIEINNKIETLKNWLEEY